MDVTSTPTVPTESEMANIRGIFERAANAIVGYSELGIRVSELQTAVDTLRRDLDRVREHNRWLEEQLLTTRHERDEARHELALTKQEVETANNSITTLRSDIAMRDNTIKTLQEQNAKLDGELDETLGRAISAETELGLVKSKLEEAMDWLKEVQSLVVKPPVETALPPPTMVQEVPHVEPAPAPDYPADKPYEPTYPRAVNEPFRW